jgi:hypothetical protein
VAQGLWDVVLQGLTGTKEPNNPPNVVRSTGSEEPETSEIPVHIERTDAKASTIIMGLCSQDSLQYILLLETAKEQ